MITIINKIRNLINDNLVNNLSDIFVYRTSNVFTLSNPNIDETTIKLYVNDVESSDWTFNSSNNKVTCTETLIAGDIVNITYGGYRKYSDNEIEGYIQAALVYISVECYETFSCGVDEQIYPTPTESEENLIALIATIILGGNIRSYKTPEITITYNDGMSAEERIKSIIRQFGKTGVVLEYVFLDENYGEN